MVKILSQAGISLADAYDVQGSVAGTDELLSREVSLVHEMGGTIFSERLSGAIRRASTGATLQSVPWDIILTNLPATPFRILGATVLVDIAARIAQCSIAVQDAAANREIPIFTWDTNADGDRIIRIVENGAEAQNMVQLVGAVSSQVQVPSLGIGSDQRQPVSRLAFRGTTSAFGAGNVTAVMLLYIAFSHVGGISSYGLPVPGW